MKKIQKPNKADWQHRDPAVYYVLNAAWHVQETVQAGLNKVFNKKAAIAVPPADVSAPKAAETTPPAPGAA